MKRRLVTLAMAALLALPAVASAEVNDELFRERKDQVALFPSLGAIPSAMMEIPSKVKRMVTSKADTGPQADARAQEHARSTTDQRDFLW
jgi:hypothetical protein